MTDIFHEKICIVTGGASGIGLGVSTALLQRGAVVYLADFSQENLDAAKKMLQDYPNARFALVDVSKEPDVTGLIQTCAKENGRLDYLFNNAGLGMPGPFEQITLEIWEKVLKVNLWGVIYGMHAAVPIMQKQGFGHIVNTSSIAGVVPFSYRSVYCTSKFAVTGLSESLRYELAAKGISVTTICPGNVATPIFGSNAPPADAISLDEAVEIILAGVEQKKGLVIFPEAMQQLAGLRWIYPDVADKFLYDDAENCRQAYKEHGNYY